MIFICDTVCARFSHRHGHPLTIAVEQSGRMGTVYAVSSWDLNALFRAYRQRLFHFVRRRRLEWDTADDIVQDTFLRVAVTPSLPDPRYAQSYLYRTANNLVTDHFRRERIRDVVQTGDETLQYVADNRPSPEHIVWSRQELRRLQSAIDHLPKKLRDVLILARIDGKTYAEIGKKLDIPAQTAFSRMVRALSIVQEKMNAPSKIQPPTS